MGNNSVPKFIFRLSRFPVYRVSVLGRIYCIQRLQIYALEEGIPHPPYPHFKFIPIGKLVFNTPKPSGKHPSHIMRMHSTSNLKSLSELYLEFNP